MSPSAPTLPISAELLDAGAAIERFETARQRSENLAEPLSPEDAQIQSMPDVSPTKWHLAHTTWFFETFILRDFDPTYRPFDDTFHFLFNSYYQGEGPFYDRPCRGLISRPSLERVKAYRQAVSEAVVTLLHKQKTCDDWPEIVARIELGCHHEEQHQELMLTDIKHVLAQNPTNPAYLRGQPKPVSEAPDAAWISFDARLCEIGHSHESFAYDNERPRHRVWLDGFALASRAVTNREFLAFIEDGGYERPDIWLSDGWETIQKRGWQAPLYWRRHDSAWRIFTLRGEQPMNWDQPVCHVSYFEADAYARWAGARLPREAEWEVAAVSANQKIVNDLSSGYLHPKVAPSSSDRASPVQMQGDVWEWTQSAYSAYPGFRPAEGTIGEYNGKFMCNQFVLRGGSCVTPPGHWRPTYRNFFYPDARWQFSGLRLARDLG